jgi:hypothetical protein
MNEESPALSKRSARRGARHLLASAGRAGSRATEEIGCGWAERGADPALADAGAIARLVAELAAEPEISRALRDVDGADQRCEASGVARARRTPVAAAGERAQHAQRRADADAVPIALFATPAGAILIQVATGAELRTAGASGGADAELRVAESSRWALFVAAAARGAVAALAPAVEELATVRGRGDTDEVSSIQAFSLAGCRVQR